MRATLRRRDVAGVDRSDAGAGDDLESHRTAKSLRQLIQNEVEYPRFVRAACTATRHDESEPPRRSCGRWEIGNRLRLDARLPTSDMTLARGAGRSIPGSRMHTFTCPTSTPQQCRSTRRCT